MGGTVCAAGPLSKVFAACAGSATWNIGHPVAPDTMVLAVGAAGNTFSDRGMRWDNSGKNGLYAPIRWSN